MGVQLSIDYSDKAKTMKFIVLFFSVYAGVFSLYLSIKEALSGNYGVWFICPLILLILSLIVGLTLALKKDKPLVLVDSESILFNLEQKKAVIYQWADIKEIGIGISSVRIEANSLNKPVNVELGLLKYNDLKELKSTLVELCENKGILFSNT